jgi:hypothetical protein
MGAAAGAQSIPGAVLAKREPHHHSVYEDSSLRVLRVRVPAHDTTLLHEHDPDYFWIALGASTVVNAKLGAPDATISSPDLSIHYTPGHFAHVARNPGTTAFDNITVELLEPQANVHNLCEPALAAKPLACPKTASSLFTGVTEHKAFATNRLRVSLVSIAPGGALRPASAGKATWLIALDTADTKHDLVLEPSVAWVGGTIRPPRSGSWALENKSQRVIRALAVIEP